MQTVEWQGKVYLAADDDGHVTSVKGRANVMKLVRQARADGLNAYPVLRAGGWYNVAIAPDGADVTALENEAIKAQVACDRAAREVVRKALSQNSDRPV